VRDPLRALTAMCCGLRGVACSHLALCTPRALPSVSVLTDPFVLNREWVAQRITNGVRRMSGGTGGTQYCRSCVRSARRQALRYGEG
jgi:hypothetical protein